MPQFQAARRQGTASAVPDEALINAASAAEGGMTSGAEAPCTAALAAWLKPCPDATARD